MMSAVVGMVAVVGSIHTGWTDLGAHSDIHSVQQVEFTVLVAVSNSADTRALETGDPDAAEVHLSRGSYYLDNGDYTAALAEYTLSLIHI